MFSDVIRERFSRLTRRNLLAATGLAAAAQQIRPQSTASGSGLQIGPNLFESIGVKPLINCKGTFTIVSGSQSLPEVKQAMLEASKHYVHLDELMDAVGKRLAALTGRRMGHGQQRVRGGTDARNRCVHRRRRSREVAATPEPRRTQERGDRASAFAQRVRSRGSHARRKDGRSIGCRAVAEGVQSSNRDGYGACATFRPIASRYRPPRFPASRANATCL